MKRRIGKNMVNACVAGLMLGSMGIVGAVAPSNAFASTPATGTTSAALASHDVNVCLYGPPSYFEGKDPAVSGGSTQLPIDPSTTESSDPVSGPIVDEVIVCLYGPPPADMRLENPMVVRTRNKTVKATRVAAKKKVLKKAIVVKRAKGKVRYVRLKKGSSKQLKVNPKTGAITVAKGTEAGVYKVRVRVRAAGNDSYGPAAKTVTVKVRVK